GFGCICIQLFQSSRAGPAVSWCGGWSPTCRHTPPALPGMAEIVRAADAAPRNPRPEGAGLEAMALGFRENSKDDFENMRLQFPASDALYTFCRLKVEGKAKLEHAAR